MCSWLHHGFWGTAVIAARNIVLLTATVLALRALWKATTGPVGAAEPGSAIRDSAINDGALKDGAIEDTTIRTAAAGAAQSAAQAPDLEPAGAAGSPTAGQSRGGGRD